MKASIFVCLIILFYSSPFYGQFVKEADYPSDGVTRILLQDQTERYFYYDRNDTDIKVADASHMVIRSIPTPSCDGYYEVFTARNDFDNIDLGVLCFCRSETDSGDYLLDQDGNIVLQFDDFRVMNDQHIIEYTDANFTLIYDTQSVSLDFGLQGIDLFPASTRLNDEVYYYSHNSVDSIYYMNQTFDFGKGLRYEFRDSLFRNRVSMASLTDNNETAFYFLVIEISPDFAESFFTLIDENGTILYEFDGSYPSFHKYDQTLQVVSRENTGLMSYDVKLDSLFFVSSTTNLATTKIFSGKYIATTYDYNSGRAEFFNYKRELDFPIFLNSTEVFIGPIPFIDHLGTEYFWYAERVGQDDYNTVIYKDYEYSQTFTGAQYINVLNSEGIPTKLRVYYPQDERIGIYGTGVSSTHELSANSVMVAPNPVIHLLEVSSKGPLDNYSIYDGVGKIIKNGIFSGGQESIDVSELQPGIYFLGLNNEEHSSDVKRFVKVNEKF